MASSHHVNTKHEPGTMTSDEEVAAAVGERQALLRTGNGVDTDSPRRTALYILDDDSNKCPATPGHISRNVKMPNSDENGAKNGGVNMEELVETCHNDPDLRSMLKTTKMMGSTRMLHQYYTKARPPPNVVETSPQHRRRWSDGGGAVASKSLLGAPPFPMLNDDDDYYDQEEAEMAFLTTNNRRSWLAASLGKSVRGFGEHVHKGCLQDARSLTEGTIPQSIVLSFCIGIVCGMAAYLYYTVLFFLLNLCWTTIPERLVVPCEWWHPDYYWVYTVVLSYGFAILVGLSVILLGEPGDLPFTIACIHKKGFIPMNHVLPMFFASLFSILAGGSLGPEAPLVAMCGALGGFVSRTIFRQTHVDIVRKHTLMGMAGALAAFFGCPLGGSIFALEVNSRFGIEYYEHMVEAIFAGEITLLVFRRLSGLPIAPIWNLTADNNGEPMREAELWVVAAGGAIGLLGAAIAYMFACLHWAQMGVYDRLNLLDNKNAVFRALLGCTCILAIGILIPHTMFWGEEEFKVIANLKPASELPYVWPTPGLIGFELDHPVKILLTGFAKIVAISCTVAGGFRGGFIFPFIASGAAFGRVLDARCPWLPLPVAVLCFSAGINVAITRTSLATTLILTFLSGEPCAMPAILAASLCSLFATAYVPFIKTQITRSDLDHSMFHQKRIVAKNMHDHNS